ncbi:MAG: type II toxin-antitoxin system PemK/MazF family toxin [Thermomicrobiales bacterium]
MKPSSPEPKQGEIWDVSLSPTVGVEQAGVRPALVISNDRFNAAENYLHIIVPITGTDRGLEYQLRIKGKEGGLTRNSVLMCDQAKSVSIMRFRQKRGTISGETLMAVRQMVGILIDPRAF